MDSVLDASLELPAQNNASGNPLYECLLFVSGYVWGSVHQADVFLSDRKAASLPIHVIGTSVPVPASCRSRAPQSMNTVADFGANGVLGIGSWVEDCGSSCVQTAVPGTYYVCSGGTCSSVAVELSAQVQNPVAALDADNNGSVVEMPSVPATGLATAKGSLILGIGTQANNSLGGASVYDLNSAGNLVTLYKGNTFIGFVDTGSNGWFFDDSSIAVCDANTVAPGFYCPASTLSLSARMEGATNGVASDVDFSIANADVLLKAHGTYTAFSNLGANWGGGGSYFDWGMPFYYGRRVFLAIEQRPAAGRTGPFVAF